MQVVSLPGQITQAARLAHVEATVEAVRTGHGERLARVEGTVAGALGRHFPERMAPAPGAEDSPGG